jgi:hypothetical protein
MEKCFCKYSFSIGGNHNKIWYFKEGKEYYYDTSYHFQEFEKSKIQTKIYHVYIESDVEIPFTELRFQDRFDDRMEKREKLINQILDQPSS